MSNQELEEVVRLNRVLGEYTSRVVARGEMTPEDVARLIETRLEWVEKAGHLLHKHRQGRGPDAWNGHAAA